MRFTSLADVPMFAYGMAVVDPPWPFDLWSDAGADKSPEAHYETMPMDAIAALRIGDLIAGDGVLCLMCTHPQIDRQIEVGRAWGLRFVTSGVWVKRTKNGKLGFGTGYRLRSASEPFALFTAGTPDTAKNVRTVIEGPLREHSRKPDELYREMERLAGPVRRIDVFSREDRPGWDSFGNEVGKFNGATSGTAQTGRGPAARIDRADEATAEQPPGRAGIARPDHDAQRVLL